MSEKTKVDWLEVIGRTLSYICLEQARKDDPDKFNTIPKKVKFLIDMGLPKDAAAYVAGSNPDSVAALGRQQRAKKGVKAGAKKSRR